MSKLHQPVRIGAWDLLNRIVMGQTVIDHERITRTFPEGPGQIEIVAIYDVQHGKIATASFIYGAKVLDPSEPSFR